MSRRKMSLSTKLMLSAALNGLFALRLAMTGSGCVAVLLALVAATLSVLSLREVHLIRKARTRFDS